jgi:hypothetical protein
MRLKHISLILPVMLLVFFLPACNKNRVDPNAQVNVYADKDLAKGLDLKALGEMVKKTPNAEQLEKELNQPNSINNLDLDEDGKVDYIKVTEFGKDNVRGLSFTDDVKGGETQEIATVEITKNKDNADMNVVGNNTIYSDPGYASYHSSFGLTDLIIMSYLFSPRHVFWMSPYHYGYYPGYYHPFGIVPYHAYSSRVTTITKTTTFRSAPAPTSSRITSPNAGKNAPTVQRTLSNAHSQKSFQARSQGKSVGSGGFGNKSKSISPSRPSTPSRSFTRPSSGFRSSGRSFGRRR